MAILVAKFQYRNQTDADEADNFDDIPVVKKLKRKKAKTKVDRLKTQKRCISWPQAVFQLLSFVSQSGLWGFEDTKGKWPQYHAGENGSWQGYLNEHGNRLGWRDALKPEHDYVLTIPLARSPYQVQTFTTFVKGIFIKFTQDSDDPVPVTPHSFRHMLSTQGISDHEK